MPSGPANTAIAARKETATAPTDRQELSLRDRRVKSVMTAAASSGENRMIQGAAFMAQNFSEAMSSTCVVWRARYSATITASPTETSAAATVMMKNTRTCAL